MGVSVNSGFSPKSSILKGISIINHPFWGIPIFGNTHMFHGTGRFTDLYAIHAGFFLDVQSHGNIWESRVAAWSAATHLAKRTGSDSSAW